MPFDTIKFRYPWRPYQVRVLDALAQHMEDRRLHIVAAPGAGKTTLGLEVFRQLRKNALILSPTRVIRDQWISRLADFTDCDIDALPWVSTSIRSPKILTSITYQALHAKSMREEDTEPDDTCDEEVSLGTGDLASLTDTLKQCGIELLILDEAHHLRAEWWSALEKVCAAIPHLHLVSLTATPPYDAVEHEWAKYEQLCGPIDEEISVPELVKAGTLCAHQDFIWAVDASPREKERIREYDERVSGLCQSLIADPQFNDVVLNHPWLTNCATPQDLAKEPRVAIALLAFMVARGHELPVGLCTLLDITKNDIPVLGRHWWQTLLEAVFFSASFKHSEAHQNYIDQLKKHLRAVELLKNKELSLERSRRIDRAISLSIAKVDACIGIHKLEYKHRQSTLRQVILTDFIRDEQIAAHENAGALNFGAWPVFKGLVAASRIPCRIALLTGRLSVIHASLTEKLLAQVEPRQFSLSAIEGLTDYLRVSGPLNQLTTALTALLMQGEIVTLVGTRALLGEGWDAPALNSLVLGSVTGTFMLTNQMRGRAIRIDKSNPEKISSIWHIVAIDIVSPSGLNDYVDLKNRFQTFVGLSEKSETIESGFDRMRAWGLKNVESLEQQSRAVITSNWQMIRRYRQRASLAKRWENALSLNDSARVMPSLLTEHVPRIRSYHFQHTLTRLLIDLFMALCAVAPFALPSKNSDFASSLTVFAVMIGAALIYRLPKTFAVLMICLKHLPVDGSLKQIGMALVESLCRSGQIKTSFRQLKVLTVNHGDGTFHLGLQGGTFYESSLFADALAEILAPIDNPRYLVVREGAIFGLKRDDYHAVPLQLATGKELAQVFFNAWSKYVGPTELIYTRSEEGRLRLLKARARAFSAAFARKVKREDRWC